jgi:hypothetical protein
VRDNLGLKYGQASPLDAITGGETPSSSPAILGGLRMNKSDYHKYLSSRKWFLKKNTIIKRSKGICEKCRLYPVDHIHHATYERIGNEKSDDLLGLCEGCHAFMHGKSDVDPSAPVIGKIIPIMEHVRDDEYKLLCPKCGYDYTHVKHALSMSGGDEGGPDKNGLIYGIPPVRETPFRRNALGIEVLGECGHLFEIILQQHKGQTFITSNYVGDEEIR